MSDRALLVEMFSAAIRAADPMHCIPPVLPPPAKNGRTVVIGAGKASARMARALEDSWAVTHPDAEYGGVVLTRYGYSEPCQNITILEASHPVPDEAGVLGCQRILQAVADLAPQDLVICLISGGGSALLTSPAEGLSLQDKQAVNRALLASGATINEMNCIRRHLSKIKGGRLAAACAPAQLVSILISDVPGDEPHAIASGPTVPDPTTFAEARRLVAHYNMDLPENVCAILEGRGAETACAETPKPGDPLFQNSEVIMAATPRLSLLAAAEVARAAGVTPLILGDALEGESRVLGTVLAGIARSVQLHGDPVAAPAVLISGGETTVTLAKAMEPPQYSRKGGPNSEATLGLAMALKGAQSIAGLCCDTDGIDGSEDNAGAYFDDTTLVRASRLGLDPNLYLQRNDAYSFFEKLDDLILTGPTGTNVNDFRAILVRSNSA